MAGRGGRPTSAQLALRESAESARRGTQRTLSSSAGGSLQLGAGAPPPSNGRGRGRGTGRGTPLPLCISPIVAVVFTVFLLFSGAVRLGDAAPSAGRGRGAGAGAGAGASTGHGAGRGATGKLPLPPTSTHPVDSLSSKFVAVRIYPLRYLSARSWPWPWRWFICGWRDVPTLWNGMWRQLHTKQTRLGFSAG